MKELKEIVRELEKTMQCNCDLDNWEPTKSTGHSWVCDIHKQAIQKSVELKEVKEIKV